jgi:hypothetical protein
VLAGDVAAMQAAFGASITVHEVLSGKLSNQGEQVRIEDPQGRLADEVGFDPTFPEVGRADGTGLSIHRGFAPSVGPTGSWRAAEPTPGRFEPAALSRVAP